jgi:hypothetical protein
MRRKTALDEADEIDLDDSPNEESRTEGDVGVPQPEQSVIEWIWMKEYSHIACWLEKKSLKATHDGDERSKGIAALPVSK